MWVFPDVASERIGPSQSAQVGRVYATLTNAGTLA
jgi:hypothetical protein